VIVADENIDNRIIAALKSAGIDVVSIFEERRGASDIEIIQFSKAPQRIILTEDKDFGEWVYAHNERDISVILLRYDFSETKVIIEIVRDVILKNGTALFGKYITITSGKIRIRSL
jgi:predicted nuclease of predicted toxin-antitoxin system